MIQSNEQEVIDFETPQDINPIYAFLKLDPSKDCLDARVCHLAIEK